jgi:hypothetical protein
LSTAFGIYSPVRGQYEGTGFLGIYSDASGGDCSAHDFAPGTLTVYVHHKLHGGSDNATGASFRVATGGGFTGSYLSEQVWGGGIGDLQSGIRLSYGNCYTTSALIASISYSVYGTSPSCSYVALLPHPDAESGTIEVWDCNFILHATSSGERRLYINQNVLCESWCIVPTEPTTWGRIKGLYR